MKTRDCILIVLAVLVVWVGLGVLKKRSGDSGKKPEPKDVAEVAAFVASLDKLEDILKKSEEPPVAPPKKEPEKPPPEKKEKKAEEALWQRIDDRLAKGFAELRKLLEAKAPQPKVSRNVYVAVHTTQRLKAEFLRELAKLHDRFTKDDHHDCQLYGHSDPGRIYRNTQRNLLYDEWFQYYRIRLATEVAGSTAGLIEPAPPGSIIIPPRVLLRGDAVDITWSPNWKGKKK